MKKSLLYSNRNASGLNPDIGQTSCSLLKAHVSQSLKVICLYELHQSKTRQYKHK